MRMSGAAMAVVIGCWTLLSTAQAAPPTVTPSPGYDARLQQSRDAGSREERLARVRPLASRPHQPGRPRVHH